MPPEGKGQGFKNALQDVLVALAKAEATPDADHGIIGQIRQTVLGAIHGQGGQPDMSQMMGQMQPQMQPPGPGPAGPPGAPPGGPPGPGLPGVTPNAGTLTPDLVAALTQGMSPDGQQMGGPPMPGGGK